MNDTIATETPDARFRRQVEEISTHDHELYHPGDVVTVNTLTKYRVTFAAVDLIIVESTRTGRRRVLFPEHIAKIEIVIASEKTQKELDRRAAVAAAEAKQRADDAEMPTIVLARDETGRKHVTVEQRGIVRDYLVEKGVPIESPDMHLILGTLLSTVTYGSTGVKNRFTDDRYGELGVNVEIAPIVRHDHTLHGSTWHPATDAMISLCIRCGQNPERVVRSW